MQEPTPTPAALRPRRWKRRLALALAALVVLIVLAPTLLGPLVRRAVVSDLEERLGARATIEELSLAWPGRLHLHALTLTSADGRPLASVDDVRASVELFPLLAGKIRLEAEVVYPELHLARGEDGRWNLERVLERALSGPEAAPEPDSTPEKLPDLRARLHVRDGHVVLHGQGGDTTLADLELALHIDGLENPAPFELALEVRGPGGPGGRLALAGSATAAAGGTLGLEGVRATASLDVEEVDMAALAPGLALVTDVQVLSGLLDGSAELSLGAGLALEGSSALELRDLALIGPLLGGVPTRVGRLELRGQATQQDDGAGTQHLELRGEPFLALVYDGRSNLAPSGVSEIRGRLTLSAELEPASEIARAWVPFQPGVHVQGRLEHTLDLAAELRQRIPTALRLSSRGGVSGLAARDASGKALDLGSLADISLELEAAADLARGTLSVPRLALHAGPLSCEGSLEARGIPGGEEPRTLEFSSGALRVEADLERLRGPLAQIVALGEHSLGGHLDVRATLTGRDDGLALEAHVGARALALAGTSVERLEFTLQGQRTSAGAANGTGTLDFGAVTLPREDAAPLTLPGGRAELTLRESASGAGEHALTLKASDGALELALAAQSQRRGTDLELTTDLRIEGRLALLATHLRPLLPAPGPAGARSFGGALSGKGTARIALHGGALATASTALEFSVQDLALRDAAGERRLGGLARGKLSVEAELDAAGGSLDVRSLALEAGALRLAAGGRVLGLAPSGPVDPAGLQLEGGRLVLDADLALLGRDLPGLADLGELGLDGSALRAEVELAAHGSHADARGTVRAQHLALEGVLAAPLSLADVDVAFDVGLDAQQGSLEVRRAEASSRTGTLTLAGKLEELFVPDRARGKLRLTSAGELGRILPDLGLERADAGRKTSGACSATFDLDGDRGAFRLAGTGAIEDFRLELAPTAERPAPFVVAEPKITLTCDAGVSLARLDLDLSKLTIDSGLLRGGAEGHVRNLRSLGEEPVNGAASGEVRFEGLTGEFAYVPERLGALLAPWLPGKLTGAEEQRLSFALDGAAREFDLAALLSEASGRIEFGIGHFVRPEIDVGGRLAMETKEGKATVRGDFSANGGTLQLDGLLDLAGGEGARSRLSLVAKELRANSGLAPILGLVHPAFAGANLAQGSVDGLIGLDLDLTYDGPLSLRTLQGGWQTLPKEPISGTGRLELRSASLRGSPLLGLLEEFGVDAGRALDLAPIDFTVKKGRLSYARPWTWTLSGTETTFTGSVGLDQSLDLAWNVPVSEALVERFGFLEFLKGENLSVPLRGTVLKPRLETTDLLKGLAAQAAKKELEGHLGLGGGAEDPAVLLNRADELWNAGKKTEAAAIYARLREDYKLSMTYALNKDRIKERSKYVEPPK